MAMDYTTSLEELQKRNKFLEGELQTLRDLFQNLNEERDMESSDQRRAFMLKAQNYQLERQCMLLSQAQSNRASVLIEIESQLQQTITLFQSIIADEKSGPDVLVKRSQIMSHLNNLRKLKNSLYKQSRLESSDSLRIPSLMSGSKFARSMKPVDCSDIFKTRPENFNMKHISKLEQELSSLRKQLCSLNTLLKSCGFADSIDGSDIGKQIFSPWMKKLNAESEKCNVDIEKCCDQLLALSILHPSAPWSATEKSHDFEVIKYEKVLRSLPPQIQKNSAVRSTLKEICHGHQYIVTAKEQEIDSMKRELKYLRVCNKLQSSYSLQFSSMIWKNYEQWKDRVLDGLCKPVAGLLESWRSLKCNQSGPNLKRFLSDFKCYEAELEKLSSMEGSAGNSHLLKDMNQTLMDSLQRVASEYEKEMANLDKPAA